MAFRISNVSMGRPVQVVQGIGTLTGQSHFELRGDIIGRGGRALMRAIARANGRPVDIKVTLAKQNRRRREARRTP